MKKTTPLIEIEDNLRESYLELERYCVDNETDNPPDELFDKLQIAEKDHLEKLGNYVYYLDSLKGDYEYFKDLKKLVDGKMRSIKKRSEWAQEVVTNTIHQFGDITDKGTWFIDLGLSKISLVPTLSTVIEDLDTIPAEFTTKKEVISADRKAIKKALQSGVEIQGAILKENLSLRLGNSTLKI